MKWGFNRKETVASLTLDAQIEAAEADIGRWTAKARELDAEARSLTATDSDSSVQRDSEAIAARRLVERARASLPALYAQRFEQAIVERQKEIDVAAAVEKADVKALADRLRPLAKQVMEGIIALRAIEGVPLVWGGAPAGLRGDRLLTHCITAKDTTTDTVLARIEQDLAQRLSDLDQAAGLAKSAVRYGGTIDNGPIEMTALARDIIGGAGVWRAPPAEPPAPEPEDQAQSEDDEMPAEIAAGRGA